jgi:hypothetical protein
MALLWYMRRPEVVVIDVVLRITGAAASRGTDTTTPLLRERAIQVDVAQLASAAVGVEGKRAAECEDRGVDLGVSGLFGFT